jgi:hypothetical protein
VRPKYYDAALLVPSELDEVKIDVQLRVCSTETLLRTKWVIRHPHLSRAALTETRANLNGGLQEGIITQLPQRSGNILCSELFEWCIIASLVLSIVRCYNVVIGNIIKIIKFLLT